MWTYPDVRPFKSIATRRKGKKKDVKSINIEQYKAAQKNDISTRCSDENNIEK